MDEYSYSFTTAMLVRGANVEVNDSNRTGINQDNSFIVMDNSGSSGDSGSSGSGDSGGGCFIATAAYGSYNEADVRILRMFRDKYLLTNKWGSAFVKFYSKHSPPIAHYIEKKEPLRVLVRWTLKPLVFVAKECVSW